MKQQAAYRIHINGIVQGVGFRPFIYNLALQHRLTGWVRNTSSGVEIEVTGADADLENFLTGIPSEAPPLSRIETIEHQRIDSAGYSSFEILHSQVIEGAFQPISPDVSICDDCLRELFDPSDFRYRYPFINCTNCGPRFTIIKDIPYDRPKTTMGGFELCPTCQAEYLDPLNRRFHAQPVACPSCGPEIWLESAQGGKEVLARGDQALTNVQDLLAEGSIIAIKGLGGFHLACDAENQGAISRLRQRKNRPAKPLAVMMPDVETVRRYCHLSKDGEELLSSPQRPILLLEELDEQALPNGIAPGQHKIGVMLPYTPLHYLLFSKEQTFPNSPYSILVMTSANFRGNPILTRNQQVRDDLSGIADYFLFHDRDIHIQCDDSVLANFLPHDRDGDPSYPVRRSRGYAPQPLSSPLSSAPVLAVGGELKNTFCHTKDSYAFLSQHMGDLKNYQSLVNFQESITHYENLFRIQPALLAYDAHPDYLSTRYALERSERDGLPALPVQHHHAHIASCLADNHDPGSEPVIGLAFDGTGFGDDSAIWGGEFLIADYRGYERFGHLAYFPLPGGDLAIRQPWRSSLALLYSLGIPWENDLLPVAYAQNIPEILPGVSALSSLQNQLISGTNTPPTSSMGRLFDATAALLGIRQVISYEGQAAIELEALADADETASYPISLNSEQIFSPAPLISGMLQDFRNGLPAARIAARFHNSLAVLSLITAQRVRELRGLSRVALSGGVWQNISLLTRCYRLLTEDGFQVLYHHQVPPNDGGLALGQAVIGQKYLAMEE
ncbi:MAG: carbamoyltransferase HypF [Anaerolineales bacterium]